MIYDLESLIDRLILRIATSGFTGCSVSDLVAAIEALCGDAGQVQDGRPVSPEVAPSTQPSGSASMVWQWIVERPDIYVGRNSKDRSLFSRLSLSEILALPEATDSDDATTGAFRPRVFASDEVMWKSIAGHGPDLKRVPKFEWEALVGIASSREEGIIQGDLCRLTGQDKRSLPKRTDALAKKKYIEKRATLVRGTKTSKLWLRRFAPPLLTTDGNGGSTGTPAFDFNLPKQIETDNLMAVPWAAAWTGQAIDYSLFGKTIISTVRAFGVLRYDDLRTKLGIQHQRWQMRVMARSCRFFVKSGALQFVAASMNGRVFRDCLKFVHDVLPDVWSVYLSSSSKKVKKTRKQQIKEEEARPIAERRHKIPQNRWTPDVPFQDIIMDIMLAGGDEGITNTELTSEALAPSFGRYVANLSMSITVKDFQPPHLKHLQIRSELTRNGKTITYRYYPPGATIKDEEIDQMTEGQQEQGQSGPRPDAALAQACNATNDPALRYGFSPLALSFSNKGSFSRGARAQSSRGAYKSRKKVIIFDENGIDGDENTVEATPKPPRPRGRPRKHVEGGEQGQDKEGEEGGDTEAAIDRVVPPVVSENPDFPLSRAEPVEGRLAAPVAEPPALGPDSLDTPHGPPASEAALSSTLVEMPKRGRKSGTRKSIGPTNGSLFTCPTCEGTWKNDIGLKYHQTKSRTSCNPNWEDKPATPKKVSFVTVNADASRIETRRTRLSEASVTNRSPATPSGEASAESALAPIFRRPISASQLRGGLILESSRDTSSRNSSLRPARTPVRPSFRSLAPGETFSPAPSQQCLLQDSIKPQTPLKGVLGKKSGRKSLGAGGGPTTPSATVITRDFQQTQTQAAAAANSQQPDLALSAQNEPRSLKPLDTPVPDIATCTTPAESSEYPEDILSFGPPTLGPTSLSVTPFVMPPIKKPSSLTPEALQLRRSREVIRYLVRSNQGVFPANFSLWQALCQVWQSYFPSSDPAPPYEVCLKAAKDCGRSRPANDHLVELTYGFKDRQGGHSRYHILVEARIDKHGPIVEALKDRIKELYPTPYVPEPFAAPSSYPGSSGDANTNGHVSMPEPTPTPTPTPLTRRKRALGGEVEILNAPLYKRQVAEKVAQKASFMGRRRKRPFSWSDIGLPRKRLKALIEDDETVWENPAAVQFLSSEPVLAFVRPNECLDSNLATSSGAEDVLDESDDDEDGVEWEEYKGMQGQAGFRLIAPANRAAETGPRQEHQKCSNPEAEAFLTQVEPHQPLHITRDQIDPRLFIGLEGSAVEPTANDEIVPCLSPPPTQATPELASETYTVRFANITPIMPCETSSHGSPRPSSQTWPNISAQWFESGSSFTIVGPLSETLWERALQQQPQTAPANINGYEDGSPVPHSQLFVPTMENLEAVQTYRLLSLYPDVSTREKISPRPRASALPAALAQASSASPSFSSRPQRLALNSQSNSTPSSLMGVTRFKGRPSATQASFGGLAAKPPPPAANTERAMAPIPEESEMEQSTTADGNSADMLGLKGSLDEAMTAAFISVRTLLGGTDKAIDWGIIMSIFPGHSLISLRKFWVRLLKDQASLVKSYTDRFQNAFIKAYENGDVPTMDYDSLESYDWHSLVNWTVSLHKDERVPLPQTREEFRDQYELGEPTYNSRAWRDIYYNNNSSIFGRYEAATSEAASFCIDSDPNASEIMLPEKAPDEALARSWLRSLAITPGDKSSSAEVIAKFMTLASGSNEQVSKLLEGAVASLSANHIISKGKIISQRDRLYRLNKQFRSQFDKAARQAFFMEARTFKRGLDAAFAAGATSRPIPFLMPDGAVMALINLTIHRRLELCSNDIPHIPRGFDPGNYESRKMSKALLLFSLDSVFTSTYTPSQEIPILATARSCPVPMVGPGGVLPFWVDFFGDLDESMWQAVLGMICSLVSTRGPLSEQTILNDLHPLLDAVDVKLATMWARATGLLCSPSRLAAVNMGSLAVADDGCGEDTAVLTVSEWWWLVVAEQGPTQTKENDAEAEEVFQKHTVMLNTGRISA
ncbi:hypothetical protein Cpir12675_005512 [Ceratocystis pirilliformis]|uniref:C2H2-type domain-containing protein n=1 Tax=Ceratocystis pirilliformis TaxID=259994 RepID=A0ABR3YQM6_9PEZI